MNSVKDNDEIIAVVREINVVQGKVPGWWYDTCKDQNIGKHEYIDNLILRKYRWIFLQKYRFD